MALDAWEEFNEITAKLESLEQELARCDATSGDNTPLLDEIRKVSARRETLLAALWETTDTVVRKAGSWTPSSLETAPARRYMRAAADSRRRRIAASY